MASCLFSLKMHAIVSMTELNSTMLQTLVLYDFISQMRLPSFVPSTLEFCKGCLGKSLVGVFHALKKQRSKDLSSFIPMACDTTVTAELMSWPTISGRIVQSVLLMWPAASGVDGGSGHGWLMNAGCSNTVTGCGLSNETDELVNSCLWDIFSCSCQHHTWWVGFLTWSVFDGCLLCRDYWSHLSTYVTRYFTTMLQKHSSVTRLVQ